MCVCVCVWERERERERERESIYNYVQSLEETICFCYVDVLRTCMCNMLVCIYQTFPRRGNNWYIFISRCLYYVRTKWLTLHNHNYAYSSYHFCAGSGGRVVRVAVFHAMRIDAFVCSRSIGWFKSVVPLVSQNGLSDVDHLQSPKAWHPLWY